MRATIYASIIGLFLTAACGQDTKDNPEPKATISISENGGAGASFRDYAVTGQYQGNDQDCLAIQGLTASGQSLKVSYVKRIGTDGPGTTSAVQAYYNGLLYTGGTGTATRNASTGRFSGSFSLTFPNNQQVSGSFTDVKLP